MASLTLKKINAAIAAEGINLVLIQDDSYYPFHFEGPGVELIHHSVVSNNGYVTKKVNSLSLDEWLGFARRFAAQIAEQHARIKLPEWIKVGAQVVIADGVARETVITRIHSDGSERVTVEYENGQHTWLWGDGRHCAGPHLFRNQAAYVAAGQAQARLLKMMGLFGGLPEAQQNALIAQAELLREAAPAL